MIFSAKPNKLTNTSLPSSTAGALLGVLSMVWCTFTRSYTKKVPQLLLRYFFAQEKGLERSDPTLRWSVGRRHNGRRNLTFLPWQKRGESLIVHHKTRHRLARCLVLCIEGKGLEQGGGAAATDAPEACRSARGSVPDRPP